MSHFVVDAIKSGARYVGSSRRTRAIFGIAWRESRTARRRLLLYMSSISLGVAALVAIDSFSDNVIRSVHEQPRALLGGDGRSSAMRRDQGDRLVARFADEGRHRSHDGH
jgi:predicted lysophospholipase L1 biosynthesis ABC-type transport system permease subunit